MLCREPSPKSHSQPVGVPDVKSVKLVACPKQTVVKPKLGLGAALTGTLFVMVSLQPSVLVTIIGSNGVVFVRFTVRGTQPPAGAGVKVGLGIGLTLIDCWKVSRHPAVVLMAIS